MRSVGVVAAALPGGADVVAVRISVVARCAAGVVASCAIAAVVAVVADAVAAARDGAAAVVHDADIQSVLVSAGVFLQPAMDAAA